MCITRHAIPESHQLFNCKHYSHSMYITIGTCNTYIPVSGMNLLSTFCIAVSATQKLNCVAVGVICVAVFLVCFGEKIMLNSVTLSQLNQSRELNILKKKR